MVQKFKSELHSSFLAYAFPLTPSLAPKHPLRFPRFAGDRNPAGATSAWL